MRKLKNLFIQFKFQLFNSFFKNLSILLLLYSLLIAADPIFFSIIKFILLNLFFLSPNMNDNIFLASF